MLKLFWRFARSSASALAGRRERGKNILSDESIRSGALLSTGMSNPGSSDMVLGRFQDNSVLCSGVMEKGAGSGQILKRAVPIEEEPALCKDSCRVAHGVPNEADFEAKHFQKIAGLAESASSPTY
ncbi:uncharacterized protein NEMAJ01_0602 [Nematocida major]|uniref:uncharacterized protein n=1 Tax=Nematocida major TaxID=1912982 RepID=UPI002007E730|nr:uncharacterized protein NEMAJ01_0602 [Nematocida major]KAH9385706.1 hypothetical protein NEMAJ01_0602 [Nematocida major]